MQLKIGRNMEEIIDDTGLLVNVISGRATTAITRKLYKDFRFHELNVTPEQWVVLQILSVKDGITQQALATLSYKDKPSMTRMLDNMEKHALIVRLVDVSDKRSNLIHLTKLGLKEYQKAKEIVVKAMEDALKGLNEQEIQQALMTLKKIYGNLV
jgi:MarR family transcriptional regulator, organic hydroperoxide resistance regulator